MGPTRDDLLAAYGAAVAAADPRSAVAGAMSLVGGVLKVGSWEFTDVGPGDIVVVALGKAASAMAAGAFAIIGARRGIVVTNNKDDESPYEVLLGSHPIPDQSSVAAGEALMVLLTGTSPSDVVIFLISGGGSAVAILPVDGVSIEDIGEMNRVLIESGMPIEDINEVRAVVSRIKGGRLAAATRSDRAVTLVLSDVVGAGPEHVASGPSIGFGLGAGARVVIDAYDIRNDLPVPVVEAIERFKLIDGNVSPRFTVIGSPEIAAQAAVRELQQQGWNASLVTTHLRGEARNEAISLIDGAEPGTVAVAAGETTVSVQGGGVGGRNQEAALAGALHIEGQDVLFAALGTDGVDGPTEAAGAVVDGSTAVRARELGVDLASALRDNDSNTALHAVGDTVVTGPTGTNVADLWMVAKRS